MEQKSFWQRPEGIAGLLFMAGLLIGGGLLLNSFLPTLILMAQNTLYLAGMLAALAAVIYVVLDPKARNLVWYLYKSVMRWITGIFVKIEPIMEEVFGLTNEYLVSFWIDEVLYDKKFIFLPETIQEKNYIEVPKFGRKGIVIG